MSEAARLARMIRQSRRLVGFTGAGVSTESGIADYRSQGGIWEKFAPVTLGEFMAEEDKRLLYWQRKAVMWESLREARPGPAHRFFASLHRVGRLAGLITQNIDGLHEKSGIPPEDIVNLHGTSLEIVCLSCGDIQEAAPVLEVLDLSAGAPRCAICSGLLKPNTISFGQSLRPDDLLRAESLARDCDLMIVAGSTLIVHPAASFPLLAKHCGAKLVILTLSSTPLDGDADLVVRQPLGSFLQTVELP